MDVEPMPGVDTENSADKLRLGGSGERGGVSKSQIPGQPQSVTARHVPRRPARTRSPAAPAPHPCHDAVRSDGLQEDRCSCDGGCSVLRRIRAARTTRRPIAGEQTGLVRVSETGPR